MTMTVATMAASDYISLVQHQQVRSQRVRPTIFRDKPKRPIKRVRTSRGSMMSGGKYNYGYGHSEFATPHMDKWGEQYGYGSITGSGF